MDAGEVLIAQRLGQIQTDDLGALRIEGRFANDCADVAEGV